MLQEKYTAATEPEMELSERESEVLHLLADGFTNIEVADGLFTSKRTVEGHDYLYYIKPVPGMDWNLLNWPCYKAYLKYLKRHYHDR